MNKYEEMDAQPAMYWSLKKPVEQEIDDNFNKKVTPELLDLLNLLEAENGKKNL